MAEVQKPPPAPTGPSPIQQIYDKLNGLFGTGRTELFQMAFPARVLDKGTYDYVGSDSINASQMKPETVVDAEFRLVNDMYPLSNMIGGPTGSRVSDQYSEILQNLVPAGVADAKLSQALHDDQDKICAWLTEEVKNWDPPAHDVLEDVPQGFGGSTPPKVKEMSNIPVKEKPTLPRIDLYQKLLDAYESERFRWANFKRNARPKMTGGATPAEIDDFNRMLAAFAPIVDKKLEALWTMLLVRGNYHRVRRFVGMVDVESASEVLQTAKENLRASVMRTIDDTQDVYPVNLSPSSWATQLSTNFQPTDLLSTPEFVRGQIFDKEKERSNLIIKRNALKSSVKDLAALEKAEVDARNAYYQARDKMVKGFSDTAINLVQMYFDARSKKNGGQKTAPPDDATELNKVMTENKQPPLTPEQFNQLKDMQGACVDAQTNMQTASEASSRAMMASAAARGSDSAAMLFETEERIQSLTSDIEYLMQTLKASANPTGVKIKAADGSEILSDEKPPVPTAPELPQQQSGASVWTDVILHSEQSSSVTNTMRSSSVSESDYSVNLFFGSASGHSHTATSDSHEKHDATNTTIDMGFRVMRVDIDRPWMNTGILRNSQDFYLANSSPISTGDPGEIKNALNAPYHQGDINDKLLLDSDHALMPSWPTSFIVVKDVHIIFSSSSDFSENTVHDMQKSTSNGGGFLCFSCSSSDSSSEHRVGAAMRHDGTRLSIKIPAPQIIGWVSELCPKMSTASTYKALADSEFETAKLPKHDDTPTPAPEPES